MKFEEIIIIHKPMGQEPEQYICFIKWEGGLLCPNIGEYTIEKILPAVSPSDENENG